MRGVVRFGLVGAFAISALGMVGCAVGEEDTLDPPPRTITAETPRKVFRESPAQLPTFDATSDRTTLNGGRAPAPQPILQPPPSWGDNGE